MSGRPTILEKATSPGPKYDLPLNPSAKAASLKGRARDPKAAMSPGPGKLMRNNLLSKPLVFSSHGGCCLLVRFLHGRKVAKQKGSGV